MYLPVLTHTYITISPPSCLSREVEFIQKEDAERRRLEEAEKAHLAEIQGLQVRVNQMCCHVHCLCLTSVLLCIHLCGFVALSVSTQFSTLASKGNSNEHCSKCVREIISKSSNPVKNIRATSATQWKVPLDIVKWQHFSLQCPGACGRLNCQTLYWFFAFLALKHDSCVVFCSSLRPCPLWRVNGGKIV